LSLASMSCNGRKMLTLLLSTMTPLATISFTI
jgi:hypothetical protein